MMAALLLACAAEAQSPADVIDAAEVAEVAVDVARSTDAMRRFLQDRKRVEDGLAPSGFEQPGLTAYEAEGSPESFVDPSLPRALDAHEAEVQQAVQAVQIEQLQQAVLPVVEETPAAGEPAKE